MGFSLKWFRSKKQEELESLQVEEQKMRNEYLKRELDKQLDAQSPPSEDKEVPLFTGKPYKKIKLINDVLTIVFVDGSVRTKSNATENDFKRARAAVTEEELFDITSSSEGLKEKKKKDAEIAKSKALIKGISTLEKLEDFEIKEDSVYLKGVNRSMPQLMVERFIEMVGVDGTTQETLDGNTEYQALKKFWLKCCLNPNAQSAEDLYKFLAKHRFKIDKHGNFYAYRRVVSKDDSNKELVEFISNAYNKVKAVWKKKPADFEVIEQEGDYRIEKSKVSSSEHAGNWVGNLEQLYLDLPNMQKEMFTSAHTGKEDYKVGEVISMPRDNGDDNNHVSCSKGFHAASKAYDYSGFGDTPILVIINPIDVLAVPLNEDGKLRTCRWFFAMTLPEDEKHILDNDDFDTMDLGDVFEEKCMENLQSYVQNSFAEEVKRHTFTIPQISASEITNIVASLEDMRRAVSERVVKLDGWLTEEEEEEEEEF